MHADREGRRAADRNGLHAAVFCDRLDVEPLAEPVDALAMDGVDPDVARPEHAG